MARCGVDSMTNVALMNSLKRAATEADKTKAHSYVHRTVTVRIIDIKRRFMHPVVASELPKLERLYRPFIVEGTLYLNFLTVCDNLNQFACLLLSPRYNKDMEQNKLKCGDAIKIKTIGCRIIEGLSMFFEICTFETYGDKDAYEEMGSWNFDQRTTEEVAEAATSLHCALGSPLNPWYESVPMWPAPVAARRNVEDGVVTSPAALARLCGRAEIAHIDQNWKSVKKQFPPLVCRVRARGNYEHYRTDHPGGRMPMKINLSVYDRTGGCAVVIWDQAIEEEQANKLREGAVLLLRRYDVRTNLSNSKFKVDFGIQRKRFNIELHVQDETLFGKRALEIVPPELLAHPDIDSHLPMESQPCNTFPDIQAKMSTRHGSSLLVNEVFPVAGIVVGLSRYYRLRREAQGSSPPPIGRFFCSRWVELYDPRSELFLNVEVFINKQIEAYTALEVGDVAAFTYVRLCSRKASNITEDLTYAASTQCTELHVMKSHERVDEPHGEIPQAIRKEMRRLKICGGERRDLESLFWVGGAHQFVNTYYTNQAIRRLWEMDSAAFENMPGFLRGLALWEGRDLMISGQIVLVELCLPEPTPCERLLESSGKINHTTSELVKAGFWDALKETIPVYGSVHPYHLTLPLRIAESDRALLHKSVGFPGTSIREIVDPSELEPQSENFKAMAQAYYRVVVLRQDRKVAVSSFFLPMVASEPATMAQALHLSHAPLRKPMESPVNRNMEYSDFDMGECGRTAHFLLGEEVDVVMQVRCMGFEDYEFLFCQLYFKNSENECLY